MTDTKIPIITGKSESYMRVLKYTYKERYELLMKHGIQKFEDMCKEMKNRLAKIYYEIKETKDFSFSNFYRSSEKIQKNYKSIKSFSVGISNFAFSANKRTSVNGFKKMKVILEEYEKYKLKEGK